MRHESLIAVLITILVGGCSPSSTPAPSTNAPSLPISHSDVVAKESPLLIPEFPEIDPSVFAMWPRVTEKPVEIGPGLWRFCRSPSPETKVERQAEEDANGPHASYTIIVRVSPNAVASFRERATLPTGAVVVKEKHRADHHGDSTFDAYAVMIKREAGYDAANGDWEYAFVNLHPERTVTRGRLAECSSCHAKASDGDHLFRLYLADGN